MSFFSKNRFMRPFLLPALLRSHTHRLSSVDSGMVGLREASGLSELKLVPGRTWLVELPVLVKVCAFILLESALISQ